MILIQTLGVYLALIYGTWVCFVAIMGFRAAKLAGKLSKPVYYLALPILAIGVVLDVLLQVAATPVFFDLPHEWVLTKRLDRYLALSKPTRLDAFRQRLARWVCHNMLDVFEAGGHCTP